MTSQTKKAKYLYILNTYILQPGFRNARPMTLLWLLDRLLSAGRKSIKVHRGFESFKMFEEKGNCCKKSRRRDF